MADNYEFQAEPRYITGASNVPDRVSQDLQRGTFIVVMAALIGIGAGAVSLLLGGPKGDLVWLGFAVLALVAFFLLVRYFEAGIVGFLGVCWIVVGTPTLAEGGSGGGAQGLKISQVGLLVLLFIWAGRRLVQLRRGQDSPLYRAPVNITIFLYLAISIWSTANSMLFPNDLVLAHGPKQFAAVNILEVLMRLLALGGLVMIANSLQGRTLRAAAFMLTAAGIGTFLLGVGVGLHGAIPFTSYQAFPEIIAMGVIAAVVLTGSWVHPWVRVVCAAMVLFMVYTWFVVGAEWVSGWLGALVALAVIIFVANKRLFWGGCGVIALIVLANFSYFYQNVYVSNFYGAGKTHDINRVGHTGTFTNDRTRMWEAAAKYAGEFPLGIGLGNYRSYNKYFGRIDVWNTTTFTSAHGTYSQALSETGYPGLLALLALIFTSVQMMRGYYRALPPGRARTFVLGIWGGSTGVFCASFNGDYIFPTYHNGGMASFGACVYVWLAIGLTVAIAREHGFDWQTIASTVLVPEKRRPHLVVAPVYNHGPWVAATASAEETLS